MISGALRLQVLSLSGFEFWGLKARSRKAMGPIPCTVRTGTTRYVEMFITQVAKNNEGSHFPKADIGPPGGTCYLGTGSPLAPAAWNSWQVAQVNSGKDSKGDPGLSSMWPYRAATRTQPLQNCLTAILCL